MSPIQYFHDVWSRRNALKAVHAYLSTHVTSALSTDDILRAEWTTIVSALDLYIHEVVAEGVVAIFEGTRPKCPGYAKFSCSSDTLLRVKNATSPTDAVSAFALDVRTKLSRVTYQFPDDIADGIRLISSCELWNEVALRRGALQNNKVEQAKRIKRELSIVVDRRNKIVHEGDLKPGVPRIPWDIERSDVDFAADVIERIITDIDAII